MFDFDPREKVKYVSSGTGCSSRWDDRQSHFDVAEL